MTSIEKKWESELAEAGEAAEGFMTPELDKGPYAWVDGSEGVFIFPEMSEKEASAHYDELWGKGSAQESEARTGYYARLSAAGYMDSTDWTPINDEQDVVDFFITYIM